MPEQQPPALSLEQRRRILIARLSKQQAPSLAQPDLRASDQKHDNLIAYELCMTVDEMRGEGDRSAALTVHRQQVADLAESLANTPRNDLESSAYFVERVLTEKMPAPPKPAAVPLTREQLNRIGLAVLRGTQATEPKGRDGDTVFNLGMTVDEIHCRFDCENDVEAQVREEDEILAHSLGMTVEDMYGRFDPQDDIDAERAEIADLVDRAALQRYPNEVEDDFVRRTLAEQESGKAALAIKLTREQRELALRELLRRKRERVAHDEEMAFNSGMTVDEMHGRFEAQEEFEAKRSSLSAMANDAPHFTPDADLDGRRNSNNSLLPPLYVWKIETDGSSGWARLDIAPEPNDAQAAYVDDDAPPRIPETQTSERPMSLERARAIVGHAEKAFSRRSRIADAFAPFLDGGASSRIEGRIALLLVVADVYHTSAVPSSSPGASSPLFEGYSRTSRLIATRIMCDALSEPTSAGTAALTHGHQYDAYVAFLRALAPSQCDYWTRVRRQLGVGAEHS